MKKQKVENPLIKLLSTIVTWTYRKAEKVLRRYRAGGLLALGRGLDPEKKFLSKAQIPYRPLEILDDEDVALIHQRLLMLGELAFKTKVPNEDFNQRAIEVNKHPELYGKPVTGRTLRSYWSRLQKYGRPGLADKKRRDRWVRHSVSRRMYEFIFGCRLSKKGATNRWVTARAREKANSWGEIPPEEWLVARIIEEDIPEQLKLIADGRTDEFKNSLGITFPIRISGVVFQVDWTRIPVLIKDLRNKKVRKKSGTTTAYIICCIEANSRFIAAYRITYDQPSKYDVAAVIRDAILKCGLPDEIWTDRGNAECSKYVEQIINELQILHPDLKPHNPRANGRIEALHHKNNLGLWADVDGYTGPNVVKRNPSTKAVHTIAYLDSEFKKYQESENIKVHSATGMSPVDYFESNIYTESVDLILLNFLLQPVQNVTVGSEGISYNGGKYWHDMLGPYIGNSVLIRADPSYRPPDRIYVYSYAYESDGYNKISVEKFVCEAYELNSEEGLAVSRERIANAQQYQMSEARNRIAYYRNVKSREDAAATSSQNQNEAGMENPNKEEVSNGTETPMPLNGGKRSGLQDAMSFLLKRKSAHHATGEENDKKS